MRKIQVITDTASDIRGERKKELGVETVPLTIRFGDEVFTDGEGMSIAEFYERMDRESELPQTSAPSPGDFEKAFLKAKENGAEAIICICVSSKLSATSKSAEIAAKNIEGEIKVNLLDSNSVTAGQAIQVITACKLLEAGNDADEVCRELKETQKHIKCFGVLDNLTNLKKGGRIGSASAFFGSALNLKPIVDLSSGEVVAAAKVRTRRKSFDWLCKKVAEAKNPRELAIGHGCAEDFPELLEKLGEVADVKNAHIGEIGAVIGTHTGPGIVGLAFIDG